MKFVLLFSIYSMLLLKNVSLQSATSQFDITKNSIQMSTDNKKTLPHENTISDMTTVPPSVNEDNRPVREISKKNFTWTCNSVNKVNLNDKKLYTLVCTGTVGSKMEDDTKPTMQQPYMFSPMYYYFLQQLLRQQAFLQSPFWLMYYRPQLSLQTPTMLDFPNQQYTFPLSVSNPLLSDFYTEQSSPLLTSPWYGYSPYYPMYSPEYADAYQNNYNMPKNPYTSKKITKNISQPPITNSNQLPTTNSNPPSTISSNQSPIRNSNPQTFYYPKSNVEYYSMPLPLAKLIMDNMHIPHYRFQYLYKRLVSGNDGKNVCGTTLPNSAATTPAVTHQETKSTSEDGTIKTTSLDKDYKTTASDKDYKTTSSDKDYKTASSEKDYKTPTSDKEYTYY